MTNTANLTTNLSIFVCCETVANAILLIKVFAPSAGVASITKIISDFCILEEEIR